MNWYSLITHMAAQSNPFTAALSAMQTGLDSQDMQRRLRALEDPVSILHPEIRDVAKALYDEVARTNESYLTELPREFYDRYGRPLTLMEGVGIVRGEHSLGGRFSAGIVVESPRGILYMAQLYEDAVKMDMLLSRVDSARRGQVQKGAEIVLEIHVPMPTIRAVFELYDARGLGILSRENGAPPTYYPQT
jgi:hypothetical protein